MITATEHSIYCSLCGRKIDIDEEEGFLNVFTYMRNGKPYSLFWCTKCDHLKEYDVKQAVMIRISELWGADAKKTNTSRSPGP